MELIEGLTTFDTGEYIFREGDPGDCAYIIDSGMVEVSHDSGNGGRKMVIATLTAGDILGEMAIIDHQPRLASARATAPTVVTPIPLDYVTREIADADPTLRLFLNLVMERYRDLSSRLGQVFESLSSDQDDAERKDLYSDEQELKGLLEQLLKMQERIDSAVKKTAQSGHNSTPSNISLKMTKSLVTKEQEIKSALAKKEFCLHYQPIINLKDDQILGCEALVRWQHPSGEFLLPSHFISQAEHSGLIIDLGYWIAEEACNFQRRVSDTLQHDLTVNINLSGKQFEDQFLVPNLINIMDKTGARREQIKFEVTESLLIDNPELASESLNLLKDAGAKLAIDDFGTGYSSFSYLTQFPFDTLKIDRAFVSAMTGKEKSDRIVKSLINLAFDLGMDVVAEGVETLQVAELLRHYKATYGQGWHFSRPIGETEIISLLQKQNIELTRTNSGQSIVCSS